MACDHPLRAFRSTEVNEKTGKRSMVFGKQGAEGQLPAVDLPCGRCQGCREERMRQWGVRMVHEAKMYEQSCFVTLTYADEHLPADYGLEMDEMSAFMKRLRSAVRYEDRKRYWEARPGETPGVTPPSAYRKVRFYGCGEYGEKGGRPHYHIAIFNWDAPDKVPAGENHRGDKLYTSAMLDKLWGKGMVKLGAVSMTSAQYIAGYCMKKISGDMAKDHYHRVNPYDGKFYDVEPESARMSRRPGIGIPWLEKFKGDVFPSGFVVVDGRPQGVPKAYKLRLSEEEATQLSDDAWSEAQANWSRNAHENSPDRRKVRAEVRKEKRKLFNPRTL